MLPVKRRSKGVDQYRTTYPHDRRLRPYCKLQCNNEQEVIKYFNIHWFINRTEYYHCWEWKVPKRKLRDRVLEVYLRANKKRCIYDIGQSYSYITTLKHLEEKYAAI